MQEHTRFPLRSDVQSLIEDPDVIPLLVYDGKASMESSNYRGTLALVRSDN
jgi:hypothetical protein